MVLTFEEVGRRYEERERDSGLDAGDRYEGIND